MYKAELAAAGNTPSVRMAVLRSNISDWMKSLKMDLLDTYTYKEKKNAGPVLFIVYVSYTVEQYMFHIL